MFLCGGLVIRVQFMGFTGAQVLLEAGDGILVLLALFQAASLVEDIDRILRFDEQV